MAKKKTTSPKEAPTPAIEATKVSEVTQTLKSKPMVRADEYTLVFSAEEMISTINILSLAKDIFNQMAINLNKEGEGKAGEIYSARAIMSQIIYAKFRDTAEIGEPVAREIH